MSGDIEGKKVQGKSMLMQRHLVPVSKLQVHPVAMPWMDLLAMQTSASPYLKVTQLSEFAVRCLLWTQPIQAVRQGNKYLCIAGLRTLQAARAMVPNEEVPVDVIRTRCLPIDLETWAGCDLFLKSLGHLFFRDRPILRAAYEILDKTLIRKIAPRHWSKTAFTRAAGYSRQHGFYAKEYHDKKRD